MHIEKVIFSLHLYYLDMFLIDSSAILSQHSSPLIHSSSSRHSPALLIAQEEGTIA